MTTEQEIEDKIKARMIVADIARYYHGDGRSFEDFMKNERMIGIVKRYGLEKELDHIFYLVWRRRKCYD